METRLKFYTMRLLEFIDRQIERVQDDPGCLIFVLFAAAVAFGLFMGALR